VTVLDVTPPILTCPANIVTPPGNCSVIVDYTTPTAIDNCPSDLTVFLFTGPPSGALFPGGVTEITWGADDGHGNTVFCTFTVTVNSDFTASAVFTQPVCNGFEDGTATATPTGGMGPYGYEWDDPANQLTQTATGLAAGIYHVSITDANGCVAAATVQVTEPTPITVMVDDVTGSPSGNPLGAISITPGGGNGAFTFEWIFNGNVFSDEEDQTGLLPGSYIVNTTDGGGCTVSDTIVVPLIDAVNDLDAASRITLQPNPTSGLLSLDFDLPHTAEVRLTVFDLTGRPVLPELALVLSKNKVPLDLGDAAAGVYFLQIVVDETVVIKRVLVNR
jgi:hypothetical protein